MKKIIFFIAISSVLLCCKKSSNDDESKHNWSVRCADSFACSQYPCVNSVAAGANNPNFPTNEPTLSFYNNVTKTYVLSLYNNGNKEIADIGNFICPCANGASSDITRYTIITITQLN